MGTDLEDDSDSAMWAAHHEARREKRASNTKSSTQLLTEAGIQFTTSNGVHLQVKWGEQLIDFWPSTGLWIVRGATNRHRGVQKLIKFVKG